MPSNPTFPTLYRIALLVEAVILIVLMCALGIIWESRQERKTFEPNISWCFESDDLAKKRIPCDGPCTAKNGMCMAVPACSYEDKTWVARKDGMCYAADQSR